MGVLKQERRRARSAPVAVGFGGGAVVAIGVIGLILVLMLFNVIPSFRTKTIERNQPPVLQRLERLNKFTAASGTFNVVIDTEKDVDGLPSSDARASAKQSTSAGRTTPVWAERVQM